MEIDTHQQTHPNPQPSAHHRKIDLQSPLDLTYLQQNLANSALAKLDLHFPPIPSAPEPATVISLDGPVSSKAIDGKVQAASNSVEQTAQQQAGAEDDDPLRTKVRALISEFLHNTWSTAQHNLTLNGLDASDQPIPISATLSKAPSSTPTALNNNGSSASAATQTQELTRPEREGVDFAYAPFDPRLQQKLASLHGELEKLTSEVSALRRTAPKQGAAKYQSALDEAIRHEDAAFERRRRRHHQNNSRQIKTRTNKHDPSVGIGMEIDDDNVEENKDQAYHDEDEEDDIIDLSSTISMRPGWNKDVSEIYEHGLQELQALAGVDVVGAASGGNGVLSSSSSRQQRGNTYEQVQVPPGLSLTETMGKVQRARTVAMEMD